MFLTYGRAGIKKELAEFRSRRRRSAEEAFRTSMSTVELTSGTSGRREPRQKSKLPKRQIEIVIGNVVLQRAEVAQVAAHADHVVELRVQAAADVDAQIIGRQVVEQTRAAAHVRADQAEAGRAVRTEAAARRQRSATRCP